MKTLLFLVSPLPLARGRGQHVDGNGQRALQSRKVPEHDSSFQLTRPVVMTGRVGFCTQS